jgi:FolB domain-containing protein
VTTGERIIEVRGLEVHASVGVPEEERASRQRLLLDLRFAAAEQPRELHDDIARTVDYFLVTQRVRALAEESPRRLIETLADDVADVMIGEYPICWIEVTIRKFIVPGTEWVSVSVRREANGKSTAT